MKCIYLFIFICIANPLLSQIEIRAGIYPKGSFTNSSKRSNNPGNELILFFTPGLNVGYRNTNFISKYSIGKGWSQLREVPTRESIHFSLRQYFVKSNENREWTKRVNLFGELEYSMQKWRYENNNIVLVQDFSYYGLSPFIGFDVIIIDKLKMEVGYGYRFFKDYNHPDLFFGFIYQII